MKKAWRTVALMGVLLLGAVFLSGCGQKKDTDIVIESWSEDTDVETDVDAGDSVSADVDMDDTVAE